MPIIIATCILILILLSTIEIEIEYKRENVNDSLTVTLKYLSIKLYEFDISMIDFSKGENGYGFKLSSSKFKKKPEDEGDSFVHFETIINLFNDIKKYYKLYSKTLNDITKRLRKSIIIRKLDIKVEIGTFEHALTGIVSGMINALLWNILSLVSNNVKTKIHKALVNPRFDKNIFKLNLFCIFTIRIGNIIYVVIRLVLLYVIHKILNINKNKKTNNNLNVN